MSRSNPTADHSPHPCQKWLEWDGSEGGLRYYDKAQKKNIPMGVELGFIVLDQTVTIKGWHDGSDSGIYSNEVRDTKDGILLVKAFKGGELANGLYANIRDKVVAHGGKFTANIYLAYRVGKDAPLSLACLQLSGAALNAWIEFRNEHRSDIYTKAIRIKGFTEGKKGKITFRVPNFHVAEITPESDEQAKAVDKFLQDYLTTYFGRSKTAQTVPPADVEEPDPQSPGEPEPPQRPPAGKVDTSLELDEVPFN